MLPPVSRILRTVAERPVALVRVVSGGVGRLVLALTVLLVTPVQVVVAILALGRPGVRAGVIGVPLTGVREVLLARISVATVPVSP